MKHVKYVPMFNYTPRPECICERGGRSPHILNVTNVNECNIGITEKLPFGINITTEIKT